MGTVESSAGHVDGFQENFEMFGQSKSTYYSHIENDAKILYFAVNGREIHRIINSQVETSKIGCQIAEQVLDSQRREGESSSSNSPNPDLSLPLPSTNVIL